MVKTINLGNLIKFIWLQQFSFVSCTVGDLILQHYFSAEEDFYIYMVTYNNFSSTCDICIAKAVLLVDCLKGGQLQAVGAA
jgi:hypothetical protein